jgi:uncharacterized membrane protein YkgB
VTRILAVLDDPRLEHRVHAAGSFLLRYALVFLMLMWGSFKFFAFEAEAIRPLAENSPLTGWLYPLLGVRGTSALFGVTQVPAAVLIAAWRLLPRVSAVASLFAAGMLLTTLSFLVTTPAADLAPFRGFLLKDAVLLGAALSTAAESLALARARR